MSRIDLCKNCLNKECNLKEGGIRCGLTHAKPAFENTCTQYQEDVKKIRDDRDHQIERKKRQYPLGLKIVGTIALVWGIYKILSLMFVGALVTF